MKPLLAVALAALALSGCATRLPTAASVRTAQVEMAGLTISTGRGQASINDWHKECPLGAAAIGEVLAEAGKLEPQPTDTKGFAPDFTIRMMMTAGPDRLLMVLKHPEGHSPKYPGVPAESALVGLFGRVVAVPRSQVDGLYAIAIAAGCDPRSM